MITKVDKAEREDILYIRSAIPTLNFLCQCYKYKQNLLVTQELLISVIEQLEQLVFWILDIEEFEDLDAVEIDGIP